MHVWISITISLIALILSGLTYLRNRRNLIQLVPTNEHMYQVVASGQIAVCPVSNKENICDILPDGILVQLSFLNPSPVDIAYFHLGFFTDDYLIEAITEKSYDYKSQCAFIYTSSDGLSGEIKFPHQPYGSFKANSYTSFACFMPIRELDTVPKKVDLQISYAIKRFPFIGKTNSYKVMSIPLDLSNIGQEIQKQKKLMQQVQVQMQLYPKKSPSHKIPK